MAPLARDTGSRSPSGSWTRTFTCSPRTASCLMAAGRRTSVDTMIGWRPSRVRRRASLALVVVLPEPCRPRSRMTRGDAEVGGKPPLASPNSASISSRTIATTCWAGVRLLRTSSPTARSRTRSINALTTLKLTSASSSAIRISRSAASTDCSVRRASPRIWRKTSWRRSLRESNMTVRPAPRPPHGRPDARRQTVILAAVRRRGQTAPCSRPGANPQLPTPNLQGTPNSQLSRGRSPSGTRACPRTAEL